jgi:putative ABC transport system substrate-binding protein
MAQTRRTFLAATAALAAAPFAQAQQTGNKAQVGVLSLYSPEIDAHLLKAFKNRLAALGWIDGQTISYTLQYANNQPARLPELASELFDSPVSVIFAGGDLPTQALKKAGGKTPVVFAVVNIPVEQGLVESLARPGGTITGIATQGAVALAGKRLEILKEALPGTTQVGVLVNKHRFLDAFVAAQAEAAKSLGLSTTVYEVNSAPEIEAAVASMVIEKIRVGLVGIGQLLWKERELIGTLSKQHKIPFIAGAVEYARAGCLVAYSPSNVAQVERAAEMTDKILRGASPAEIPVEFPDRFNLVISAKVARDLKITIPQSVLLRATRIIE